MIIKQCNMCGKEFDEMDDQENFGFHYRAGYGSEFDDDNINLDLCCKCFDELMRYIIPKCKYNPVRNQNGEICNSHYNT